MRRFDIHNAADYAAKIRKICRIDKRMALFFPQPEYHVFARSEDEQMAVLDFIKSCHDNGIAYRDMAIANLRRDRLRDFQSTFHIHGIPYQNLENSDTVDKDGVVLSTMHNMKGLEFKVVVITGISNHTFPSKPYNWAGMDKREQTNHLMNQRSLMYVAITRAMQKVLITGVGEKSELLK